MLYFYHSSLFFKLYRYVTDKWLSTWELLRVALQGWMDRAVAALTVPFDVLLEGELSRRSFELSIDGRRVLAMCEPARQVFGRAAPRVTLHAPPGDTHLALALNGRTLGTAIRVQARKCVQLAYDPDFELGALTLTESAPAAAAQPPAASVLAPLWDVCSILCGGSCCGSSADLPRRRSFEMLLADEEPVHTTHSNEHVHARSSPRALRIPLTDWELERSEPAVLYSGAAEEVEQRLRVAGRPLPHVCLELTDALADDPAAAASLADAIIGTRTLRYLRFSQHALPARELAAVVRRCDALESVRGVPLTLELVDALQVTRRLREVGLSAAQLSRPAQVSLLERLLTLPSVQALDLSHCDMGLHVDLLRQLDHSLRQNRSLQLLYLRSNQLKPKGMCNLLDCLAEADPPTLRGLFLHFNSIGTESLRRVVNWVIHGRARLRYC